MNALKLSLLGLAFLGAGSATSSCGIDLDRASQVGLPPMYCFEKQAGGNQTFGGYLGVACEGKACPVPNTIFSL